MDANDKHHRFMLLMDLQVVNIPPDKTLVTIRTHTLDFYVDIL